MKPLVPGMPEKQEHLRVSVNEGKYTVVHDENGLRALRYGEEWRDCVGDNLICALAYTVEEERIRSAELLKLLQEIKGVINNTFGGRDRIGNTIILDKIEIAIQNSTQP